MKVANSIFFNASANILQIVFGAILLFVLYRFISLTLGIDKLGVWSVILATASASRLADLGLSGGVTRFVARDLILGLPERAASVVETAVITSAVIMSLVLIGILPILEKLLEYFIGAEEFEVVSHILPFALLSLWFNAVASVVQSGLDGCQRMVPRAAIVILSQCIFVISAYALVSQFDLLGLAWAQIAQGVFLLIVGWLVLRQNMKELLCLPLRWRMDIFREMFGYSANLQVSNILMLLFDPLTKVLMAKYGGLAAAGYFEIANQFVIRLRTLIGAANQAMVPVIAQIAEKKPNELVELYTKNIRILIVFAIPSFTLLYAWSGLLAEVFFNTQQIDFVLYLKLSVIAWFINTVAGPAYITNIGRGTVSLNTITHVIIGVLNIFLAWGLGNTYGANGVAYAYSIALSIGSLVLIIVFQKRQGITVKMLNLTEHIPLVLGAIIINLLIHQNYFIIETYLNEKIRWSLIIIASFIAVFLLVWIHPYRKIIWNSVLVYTFKKEI